MPPLIDGGCFVGQPMDQSSSRSCEDLIHDFDRRGIAAGIVGSYRCLYQDLIAGNREMAEMAARHPERIVPLAILHPAYYGKPLPDLLEWLKNSLGFRIAGFFSLPVYYPIDWESPLMKEAGHAARDLGMILQAGIGNEEELNALARTWGDLDVPVMIRWMAGHRYRMLAHEKAVARRCPNFHFDVGNLCSTGAIAHFAGEVGADRLFFASNSPQNLIDPPLAILWEAGLGAEDRESVSGGTIAKLTGFKARESSNAASDAAWSEAWAKLEARPKVDTHWHPDHWNLGEPEVAREEQERLFDSLNYEKVVAFSIEAINYCIEAGNEKTARLLESDERYAGLIVVNPLQEAKSLEQIDRYADHPGFVGIKTIQDNYGMELGDSRYEPILAEAEKRDLPVLAHLTGLAAAAEKFPGVRFVGAHGNWERARNLRHLENVWFDFSTSHAWAQETQLARFIDAVGPERVLFGSDGQLVTPAWSLSKLIACDLSDEELDLIVRRNACRVFTRLQITS